MGGTRRGPQEDWEAEVSLAAIGWSRSGSCPGRVAPEGPPAPGHRGVLRGAGCRRPGGAWTAQ